MSNPPDANAAPPHVIRRPGVLAWIRYAFGGGLPSRNSSWVLFDTTCRTWAARHAVRALLQMSPLVVAILVFVPGEFLIKALSALGGLIMGMVFSLGYMVETTEHRVVKAGYPVGLAERIREERSTGNRRAATAARRAKMAARMERRLRS